MSYLTQSLLASDKDIYSRVTACAATQGIESPEAWANQRRWELSAEPGWDPAYASAIAAGVTDPGAAESVITDQMILAAVQLRLPPTPSPA